MQTCSDNEHGNVPTKQYYKSKCEMTK